MLRRYLQSLAVGVALALGNAPLAFSKDAAAYLDEARASLDKNDLKTAVIQLKNVLQQQPDNATARLLLGKAYLRQGAFSAAEKELQQAKAFDPAGGEWRLPLATVYLWLGKYDSITQDIGLLPDDPPATRASLLAMAGLAELGLKRFDSAAQRFAAALQLNPGNVEALTGAARLAAIQDQNFSQAEVLIDQALQSDSHRAETWVLKGEINLLQQRYPEARTAYQQVLELQPDNLFGLLGRAQVNSALRQWDNVLTDVDRIDQLAADLPAASYLRARALLYKNNLAGAEEAIQPLLKAAPDNPDTLLLQAQLHIAQNQSQQADRALSRFLEQYPQHLPARKLLGGVKLKLDQAEQAIAVLQPALAQAPQDQELLLLLGLAYIQNKDHAQGSTYLQQAAERQPDSGQMRSWLALLHLGVGRLEEAASEMSTALALGNKTALEQLEQAFEHNPEYTGAGLLLIHQYLRSQDNAKALAVAERLRQTKPDDPEAQRVLALTRLANGDTTGALTELRRLVEARPDSAADWHALALAKLKAGDRPGAAAALDRTLRLQSGFLPALLTRIQLNLQDKRYAEALQDARFLQAQPTADPALGYRLEGDIQRQRGAPAKAAAAYGTAYARAPSGALALALAEAEAAQGNLAAAVAALQQWLSTRPKDPAVLWALAGYLLQNRQLAEAAAAYERLVALAPDNADALNNLAWLYQQTGDPRALDTAEKAAQLAPERPEILDTLGWILTQNRQPARAAELLAQAAAKAPQAGVIRYHLAVALAKAGRPDKARQELQTLLNSGLAFEEQREAQALLRSLPP